jgi:hypothetical protein
MENSGKVSEIMLLSVSALSGFRPRDTFITGFDHYLKYNDNQRMNLSSSILFLSSKLSLFLEKVCHMDNLAEYFYIEQFETKQAERFRDNVANFIAEVNIGKHFIKESSTSVYAAYLQEGKALLPQMDKKSFDYQMVNKIMRDLVTTHDKLSESFSPLGGERVEPVGILLRGKSAVMKSILMKRIGDLICRTTLPEDWKDEYEKNPSGFNYIVPKGAYFDKYSYKSWVTYFDDIFQQRDAVSPEESEALRIISMINSAPYLLTMAAVDQKNTTYFRAPFVLASTNLENPNLIQSVVSTDAVFRRFTVTVDVSVNPKYANESGKYMKSALPTMNLAVDDEYLPDNTFVPNDFWTLKLQRFEGTNKIEEKEISFEDLMVTIIEQYQTNVTTYYVNKSTNKKMADKIAERLSLKVKKNDYSRLFTKSSEVNKETLYEDTMSENSDDPVFTLIDAIAHQFEKNLIKNKGYENDIIQCIYSRHGHTNIEMGDILFNRKQSFLLKLTVEELHSLLTLLKGEVKYVADFYVKILTRISKDEYIGLGFEHHDDKLFNVKVNTFRDNFAIPMKKFTNFIMDNKFTILFFGGMLTSLVYYIIKKTAPLIDDVVVPESVDLNRMKAPNKQGKQARIRTIAQIGKTVHAKPQSGLSNDMYIPELPKIKSEIFNDTRGGISDIKAVVCNKFLYVIYLIRPLAPEGRKTLRVGHCVNIKSNYFEMPLHYIYQLAESADGEFGKGSYVILSSPTKRNNTRVYINDFLEHYSTTDVAADNDRCIVHIPIMNANSTGVYQFLLNEADVKVLARTGGFKASLLGTYHQNLEGRDLLLKSTHFNAKFTGTAVAVKAEWFDEDSHYALNETVVYSAVTGEGDCGSLLFIENNQFNGRYILGFHIAGSTTHGYSNIVTQERVDQLFEVLEIKPQCFTSEEIPKFLTLLPVHDKTDILAPSYKIDPSILSGSISFSSIKKSAFHSRLPAPYNAVATIPAKLRPFTYNGIEIDPWKVSLLNYAREPQPIPYAFLEGARDSYYDLIYQNDSTPLLGKRIIPLEEALHAFENVSSISPSTSAGLPYKFKGETDWKKEYYTACQNLDDVSKDIAFKTLEEDVNNTIEMYRNNIRPWSAYIDCLKDEKRERAKALKGSTRMFSACSFNKILLIGRMYFGSFMSMFTRLNIKLGHGIGLNPYSKDWDVMSRELMRFVDRQGLSKFGAGDYSKFDGSETQAILWLVYDIIARWYGPSDQEANMIRQFIWSEVVNSIHLNAGNIFEWDSSLPSGCWLTALINSIYNHISFRVAFQFADHDIKTFNSNVVLYVLGDDNVFSVSADLEDTFNELTLPGLMAKLGMSYTTESKGVALTKFRRLEDIEFLKRSFRYDPKLNRWVAPIQIKSIAEMLNWTQKGILGDTIAVDNVGSAIKEFSLHGKKVFDEWVPPLLELKTIYYPDINPNTPFHFTFETAYKDVLKTEWCL